MRYCALLRDFDKKKNNRFKIVASKRRGYSFNSIVLWIIPSWAIREKQATAMFLELVNRGSSGKLYTWQSNILLPYGSWNSPSLHPGPWPSRRGQTRSTAARYVTWTSDVFSPRGISRNGCTCSFHSCYEFRVVLPTCIWQYNSYVSDGKNGKGRKKREWKSGGVVQLLQILKIFFQRRIICRDFELRTMSEHECLLLQMWKHSKNSFFVKREGGGRVVE